MTAKLRQLETKTSSFNFSPLSHAQTLSSPEPPEFSKELRSKNSKKIESTRMIQDQIKKKKKFTFQKFFEQDQHQAFDYLLYNYDDLEPETDPKEIENSFRASFAMEGSLIHPWNKKQLSSRVPFKNESSIYLFSMNKLNSPNVERESLWYYDTEKQNLIEWDLMEHKQKAEHIINIEEVTCLEIARNEMLFANSEETQGFSENPTIKTQWIHIIKFEEDNSISRMKLKTDHADHINVIKISKNGKMMVSASKDFSLTIWECENKKSSFKKAKFLVLDYKSSMSEILPFVITDKELIYSPSSGKIKYEKADQLVARGHASDITCFLMKDDETQLVTGSQDCQIKIWNFDQPDNPEVLKFKKPIIALAFDKSEEHLFSSSMENLIRIWDLKSKHIISQLDFHSHFARKINISTTGNFLAIGTSDNTIKYFSIDLIEKEESRALNYKITFCALSPDGKSLFIGSKHHESEKEKNANQKKTKEKSTDLVKVLDITNDITTSTIPKFNSKGHNEDIVGIVSTPDGKKLISASSDSTINLYSLENQALLYSYPIVHTESITALVIIDDKTIATGGEDNRIIIWDLNINSKNENPTVPTTNENKNYKIFQENCHVDMVGTLAFCAKGKKLISGGGKLDHFIKIWDYEKQILIGEIEAHRQRINCLLVSKTDKHLFTGSKDGTIKKWDLATKNLLSTMEGHTDQITFLLTTELMKVILSGSADGDIRLWEEKHGMKMGILRGNSGRIVSLVISKDQNTLFSVTNDNVIRKWNLQNYVNLNLDQSKNEKIKDDNKAIVLKINEKPSVSAIHLTNDEDFVIVGYRDGSLLIFDLESNQSFHNRGINSELDEVKKEFRSRKNLAIENMVSKDCFDHLKNIIQIWACCNDNKIREFKFEKNAHRWVDQKGEIVLVANNSIYCLELLEGDLFYGNGNELNCLSKEIDNDECHSDYILSISCSQKYVVTGSKDKSFILWENNEQKQKVEKLKKIWDRHDEGLMIFVKLVQSAEKILTASSDGVVKIWDRERMEVIKKFNAGVGLYICCSYIDKSKRLLLVNNMIIDLQNDIFLFKSKKRIYNFNRYRTAFSKKHGKLFMISEENNDFYYGSLVSYHLFNYMREYSTFYFFFFRGRHEDLSKTTNKIFLSVFKGDILFWPYFYNFLHINALMNNNGEFTISHLENFNNLPLCLFLQVDYKQRTCIDILLQKPRNKINLNLISIYFNLLFMAFDQHETEFYQKIKFLNYDFRKLEKPENIFQLFQQLMKLFHEETSIICEILKRSYIDHPNLKLIKKEFEDSKKKLPILCTANDKMFVNLNFNHRFKHKLEHFLSYIIVPIWTFGNKILIKIYGIRKRTPNLNCKIVCLPDLMHFNIKEVEYFFKHICAMDLSNEIYSSKSLILISRYKWNVELRSLFIKDMTLFVIFMFFFHFNFVYLLPLTEDGISNNFLLFVGDLVLCGFLLYFSIVEIIQIHKFHLKKYLHSIFNLLDILLIVIVSISVGSNILQMINADDEEYEYFKLIYSISSFFTWMRLVSYYRGFISTGFLIRLIIKVFYDMRHFLLILVTVLLSFTCANFVMMDYGNFTVWDVFISSWRILIGDLSAYGIQFTAYYYSVAARSYLIVGCLITTITFLNLIVSILFSTYNKVVKSEEKTSNYELMNIIYDMESVIDLNICCKRDKTPRFEGKYLIHLFEELKIQKSIQVVDEKKVVMGKNMERGLKILKGMTEIKIQKELLNRKKEIIEKKFFKYIVMRETQDIYQVLLEINDHLNKAKVDSTGEKLHLINSLILYIESIKEAMVQLFYLTAMNQRDFEEKSNDFVKLLLFELDELYKYMFLNCVWWTGEGEEKLFLSIENIRKNLESLDLSVGVYFTSEGKKLKDLESITKMLKSDNLKKEEYEKFNYLKAANFWLHSFGTEDHITFKAFIIKFKELIYFTEMKSLNEIQIDILREKLQNEAHMVSYRKWDDYYGEAMWDYEKRQEFLKIANAYESQKINEASLVLEYQYIDERKKQSADEKKKNSKDFPDFNIFIIKKDQYEYENFKGEVIQEFKDLWREGIIFGRETTEFVPEISFHSEIATISNKQFQISTTRSSDKFYICDLSIGIETFLLVELKKYLLAKNMLLQINKIIFEVSEMYPPLNELEKSDNYYIMDRNAISSDYSKDKNEKAFLKLTSLDGSFPEIILENKKQEYNLGLSTTGNDYIIGGALDKSGTQSKSDFACKITFENNHWAIQSNNLYNKSNYFSNTFLFLKNRIEYEKNQIGFTAVALEIGMKIYVNSHLFKVVKTN